MAILPTLGLIMKSCFHLDVLAGLAVVFLSWTTVTAEEPVTAWHGRTMGSVYTVKIVGALAERQAAAIKDEVEKRLQEVNRQMSHYQPDSELSQFNRSPANVPFKVSHDFAQVVRFTLGLSESSGGALDPTLAPVINLWGFGEQTTNRAVPSASELQAALKKTGWRHLSVTPRDELVKDIPDLTLNLSAVAKGFGVDQIIDVLLHHGHTNLYASIAGEVRVMGLNARGTPWRIGISTPVENWREDGPMAAVAALSNQAISTSGDYQKFFFDAKGRRLCHIFDPATGWPVQHALGGVSVVATNSMTADALSTVLFVLGAQKGKPFIDAVTNAAALFIIREPNGAFRQLPSSRFSALTGSSTMTRDVYVWQRSWNEQVVAAMRERATNFSTVVILSAEVTWQGGQPKVIHVPVNWEAVPRLGPRVGLALRIGPFNGPFASEDERAKWLARLAGSIVAEATNHQYAVDELQLDFDCAESKLEGYSAWVATIRHELPQTRLVITALPSWLKQPAFQLLARTAGEYVLQVHSLERPTRPNAPFTLCDADLARQAVMRAAKLGVPFRVALPTYGYLVAFDSEGKFVGLSAEGPMRNWRPGTQLREIRSDPAAIAELVRGWNSEQPARLQGIIWYRLPVEGDELNWSWPTLSKVMCGETPRPALKAEVRRAQSSLFEFSLFNEGDADYTGHPELLATWSAAQPLASDGLRGFAACATATNMLCFKNSHVQTRLRPQERQMIGWLRLTKDAPVDVQIRQATGD